jgi:hypothetical protein
MCVCTLGKKKEGSCCSGTAVCVLLIRMVYRCPCVNRQAHTAAKRIALSEMLTDAPSTVPVSPAALLLLKPTKPSARLGLHLCPLGLFRPSPLVHRSKRKTAYKTFKPCQKASKKGEDSTHCRAQSHAECITKPRHNPLITQGIEAARN